MNAETRQNEAVPARALYYVAPQQATLKEEPLAAEHDSDMASVSFFTLYTGLSRGTERLVFDGKLPQSEWQRMRAPHQVGEFPFPVKYGYSAVGIVQKGPDSLAGQTVFALFPHQDKFVANADDVVPLPAHVPPRRAILGANMETALNGIWDGGVSAGHDVLIVGAGVVGALLGALAARIPGVRVGLVDVRPERAELARMLGAGFFTPQDAPDGADIVFHTSATEAGLKLALKCAGFEGRIIEMSWFGDRGVSLPLGEAFHSQRLQLISSQVGHVAPSHRARYSHRRRLETALALLDDPRLDSLITEEVAFDDLPRELPRLLSSDAPGLATAIRYPQA